MAKIEIQDFEVYSQKLNKILDKLGIFCESLESENNKGESDEIEEIINKIKRIKTSVSEEGKATKEKTIAYLYQHSVRFINTDKVNGDFQISKKFLPNMIAISKNKKTILMLLVKSLALHTISAIKNAKKTITQYLFLLTINLDLTFFYF